LHTPAALHVSTPVHESGSSASTTVTHAPDRLHVRHAPPHAAVQQFSSQKPLAHCAPLVHVMPLFCVQVPVASQVLVPVQVSGSSAFVTAMHAPVMSHVMQVPEHDAEQQRSSQKPLAQDAALPQDCPVFSLHAPAASHVVMPVHVSGSSALVTATHPPLASHVLHVPLHATEQHCSSQKPLAQSAALAHGRPALSLHTPVASQVLVPVQVSGSSAPVTAPHVPATLHVVQTPTHDEEQHCSLQKLLSQTEPLAHAWPLFSLHAPVESQLLAPGQVTDPVPL
jgi:hypothetical protein